MGNHMNKPAGTAIREQHTEGDRRSRQGETFAPRPPVSSRPIRRPSMVPLLLAAVLALTAVAVADRVEQRLVAPAVPAADVSSPDAAPEIADAPVAAPLPSQTPLTSAALPAGEMVLTFADGSAAISTGANEPIVEL